MLIQFLALPVLLASNMNLYVVSFIPALTIATYLAMGPGAYIMIIQSMYNKSWKSKAKILPALLVYNAGMSVNNSVAVFDAVIGKKNEFLRTPKYGIITKNDDWRNKAYNLPFTTTTLLNFVRNLFCEYIWNNGNFYLRYFQIIQFLFQLLHFKLLDFSILHT